MKFPMRIFGEINGLDPETLDLLRTKHVAPFEVMGHRLEVEYEGPCLDIEPVLNEIASVLCGKGRGYVDCLDHENWEVQRYKIENGAWTCKRINPDDSLEVYK